jgi:murein hydrolase activator
MKRNSCTFGLSINRLSMRAGFILLLFFTISFALVVGNAYGQGNQKDKLKSQKDQLEREISDNNRLLQQTRKARSSSTQEVVLLQNQIKARQKLINMINTELAMLESQILVNQKQIIKLSEDLDKLKADYARMIYAAYKTRHTHNRLMFVFASDNFNQASRRLRYFQQYNEHRRQQARIIEQTQTELSRRKLEMEQQRNEKFALLVDKESERSRLDKQHEERASIVKSLKTREGQILADIRKKQAETRKLDRRIEEIIAKEMAASKNKPGAVAPSKPGTFSLTPEESALSNSFETNKGKLPWPTERGVVSSTFGRQKHAFLDVEIENNGINILTSSNDEARAVYKGTVRYVINIANLYAVLIRHGEYFTLYSNLSEAYVKSGDVVDTKQRIGKIYHDSQDSKTELHFEVWKGSVKLDPMIWLARKR